MATFFGITSALFFIALCVPTWRTVVVSADFYRRAQKWRRAEVNVTILRFSNELDTSSGYRDDFCQVRYSYVVRSKMYTGWRANVWGNLDTARFCDFLEVRIAMHNVSCWYNPAEPAQSVLDRRLRPASLGISLFTASVLVYGAVVLLLVDGVLKLMPLWSLMVSMFVAVGGVLVTVSWVMMTTRNIAAVSIALCSATFFSTAFTCVLLVDPEQFEEAEWNEREHIALLAMPGF